MRYPRVCNTIAGGCRDSSREHLDVISPLDGSLLTQVPLSGEAEVAQAVAAARAAFPAWAARPILERARVFFHYRALLEQHRDELAAMIHEENGKTLDEARAEVVKAIEVTEFACGLPQWATGEVLEVSAGIECRVDQVPLGVVASITPFNFPCMVPHWTVPIALCLGNTFILKPSEKVPRTAQRTAELLERAGLPPGVFGVVHGGRDAVRALCDHPGVTALSFVGSTPVAKEVYVRGSRALKRVLALGGAKNHLVVLADAEPASTAENVVASVTGCAGQRCMAASVLVAVGPVDPIIARVCSDARRVVPGQNMGAVISAEAKERIERHITQAEEEGARVLVDGRRAVVPGHERGSYVGPTILDHVHPGMRIAREEVFGPVLAIVRVPDIDAALQIENDSPFGNAAAIYTRDAELAHRFARKAGAGMIGVNVGVPVPRTPFGFGGWNDSRFGVGDITGKTSIAFWTQSKKITTRWT